MRLRTSPKSLFLPPLAKGGWGRFPEIPLAPPFLKGETNPPFPPFGKEGLGEISRNPPCSPFPEGGNNSPLSPLWQRGE